MATQQMIFTEALRLYCQEHNISTRQLAKDTGMSHMAVNRFLNGANIESDNFGNLLAWALKTPSQTVAQNLPEHLTDAEHSVRQDALAA